MRKLLSLTLSLLMVVTIIFPLHGFADYDKGLQEAITKAKELFSISEDYDKFDYHVNSYNGSTEFNLYWRDSNEKLGSINVTIDSLGNVRGYNTYKPYGGEYRSKLAKVSKSHAKEKAIAFIQKVSPDVIGNIKCIDSNNPLNINSDSYGFKFIREENDVPFFNNSVVVSVDNMTGEVINYHLNWDYNFIFPTTDGILSIEDAKEIFKSDIGLELVYKFSYDENIKPYLVYTTLKNGSIDAKSGEIIRNDYRYYYDDEYALKDKDSTENSAKVSLSPEELKAIENMSDILSENEAMNIAKKFLDIDDSYTVIYSRLNSDWRNKGEYTWSFNFEKEEDEKQDYISISIDAKNSEVKSFNRYSSYEKTETVVYDRDGALDIAKKYVSSVQPDKYKNVEYTVWNETQIVEPLEDKYKPRNYTFKFVRVNDGGYVLDDGFNVTVDTVRGEIIRYNFSWYKEELPSTDSVISLEKAYDVLFNKIGLKLQYISDRPSHYYENTEDKDIEPKLVYSINNDIPLNIDPFSGKILDHTGKEYKKNVIEEYSDIDNSYAKSQIEVLAQYGISLPGDKFNPKENITQREFLYLISKTGNYYFSEKYSDSEEFDKVLYRILMNEGIIKESEVAPDSFVSRENAVKFVIRVLKYDKVAGIEGIFLVNFKDVDKISEGLKGYVAIAQGLKIIKGSNGYFYPDNNLTKEQGALVIYNLLNSNSN